MTKEEFRAKFEDEHSNCLFRYRSVNDHTLIALENNRLYFTPSEKFNDPYDIYFFASTEALIADFEVEFKSFIDQGVCSRADLRTKIRESVQMAKNGIRKNMKVICFSEVYDSMLMWSHYADDHKGFLLIYNHSELDSAPCFTANGMMKNDDIHMGKVQYDSKQLDMTEDIKDSVRLIVLWKLKRLEDGESARSNLLPKLVYQKACDWSYEKEWRLVASMQNMLEPSQTEYMECKPKGIVLGTHCPKEYSEHIKDAANRNNIPIYRMFLDDANPSFKLHIGEID